MNAALPDILLRPGSTQLIEHVPQHPLSGGPPRMQMKKLASRLACSSLLAFFAALSPTVSTGAITPPHEECFFGEIQQAGDDNEDVRVFPIPGRASTVLLIQYEMFGIPDRMVVSYQDNVLEDTGMVSGSDTVRIEVPAGSNRSLTVVVNPGGGNPGTAWNYRITEERVGEIVLAPRENGSECADGSQYRSDVLSGTGTFDFSIADRDDASFTFTVPSGAKAVKVYSTSWFTHFAVEKGCPPDLRSTSRLNPQATFNVANPNYVVIANPPPGVYGITARNVRPIDNRVTIVVDVVQGGLWERVQRRTSVVRDTEQSLAGFEHTSGGTAVPELAGPLWLVSHGNWAGPLDFVPLANALIGRYADSKVALVNWSQGAQSSAFFGAGVDSQRWIVDTSKTLRTLLSGVAPAQIRWVGHSFGSYLGFELSQTAGRFFKFVALDPASRLSQRTLSGYPRNINFSISAGYSQAYLAENLIGSQFGSQALAATAHDSVGIFIIEGPLDTHSAPVHVYTRLLGGFAAADPALSQFVDWSPGSGAPETKPWLNFSQMRFFRLWGYDVPTSILPLPARMIEVAAESRAEVAIRATRSSISRAAYYAKPSRAPVVIEP